MFITFLQAVHISSNWRPILGGWLSSDVPSIAPLDNSPESEYPTLATKYHLPEEFHFECVQGVTHSLGHLLGGDGSESKLFSSLRIAPIQFLTCFAHPAVTLIVFQPPFETFQHLYDFVRSANWADVTVDPDVLVDLA